MDLGAQNTEFLFLRVYRRVGHSEFMFLRMGGRVYGDNKFLFLWVNQQLELRNWDMFLWVNRVLVSPRIPKSKIYVSPIEQSTCLSESTEEQDICFSDWTKYLFLRVYRRAGNMFLRLKKVLVSPSGPDNTAHWAKRLTTDLCHNYATANLNLWNKEKEEWRCFKVELYN